LIHIIVLVLTKTTTKNNLILLLCKFSVFLIKLIITSVVNWIICFISTFPVCWIFPGNNRLIWITLTEFKMLVFNYTSVGDFSFSIVDHCIALIVANILFFSFKTK